MNQMKKKILTYNNEYPIWSWIRKPDLRCGGLLNPGEKGVLLEVCIPEERVLLSCFEHWHCVLNNAPVTDDENEWKSMEEGDCFLTKEQSWERIFEIRNAFSNDGDMLQTIQGVTGRVYCNEIKLIKEFIARDIEI